MKSSLAIVMLLLAAMSTQIGCTGTGISLGWAAIPIPVSPLWQKNLEDAHWEHERYERVPIMGPITSGGPAIALDPPSDDEVMRALERVNQLEGGIPLLWERQRNNVRIVKDLIADYVDPPRFYPLVGPAQQHHAHYKCTVYFSERTIVGWPIPHTLEDSDSVEVLYIDHNHLHQVGNVEGGPSSNYPTSAYGG
jgi:hypothetical protein